MDKYDELMERHAAIFAEWMRWVEAQRESGKRMFASAGVVLRKNGAVYMVGYDVETRVPVLEMWANPGEGVRVTFADPDLAAA